MAAEAIRGEAKGKRQEPRKITFKCQRCEKQRALEEMVSLTRFRPVLVVCRDCAKEIR